MNATVYNDPSLSTTIARALHAIQRDPWSMPMSLLRRAGIYETKARQYEEDVRLKKRICTPTTVRSIGCACSFCCLSEAEVELRRAWTEREEQQEKERKP